MGAWMFGIFFRLLNLSKGSRGIGVMTLKAEVKLLSRISPATGCLCARPIDTPDPTERPYRIILFGSVFFSLTRYL